MKKCDSQQTCPLGIALDQILPPEISDLSRPKFFDGIFRFELWPMLNYETSNELENEKMKMN